MALKTEHELHKRRASRNIGLGLVLGALVALVFGLTVVKLTRQSALEQSQLPQPGAATSAPQEASE